MKRILPALLVLLGCAALSYAQDGSAPLNPQFVKWRKMKAAGLIPQQRAQAAQEEAASAESEPAALACIKFAKAGTLERE